MDWGKKSYNLQEIFQKKGPTLKCLLQIGPISKKDVNDHVVQLLDRGQNLVGDGQISEAVVNYKVANLLLKEFEDDTETGLLIKCLKCLGDVYQSMGEEQEAKKYRRGVANAKKKFKPIARKNLFDEFTSMVESIFQTPPQYAQNEPLEILRENDRLTEENKQVKEENSRKAIEINLGNMIMKRQADEIEQLKAQLINSKSENEQLSKEMP